MNDQDRQRFGVNEAAELKRKESQIAKRGLEEEQQRALTTVRRLSAGASQRSAEYKQIAEQTKIHSAMVARLDDVQSHHSERVAAVNASLGVIAARVTAAEQSLTETIASVGLTVEQATAQRARADELRAQADALENQAAKVLLAKLNADDVRHTAQRETSNLDRERENLDTQRAAAEKAATEAGAQLVELNSRRDALDQQEQEARTASGILSECQRKLAG